MLNSYRIYKRLETSDQELVKQLQTRTGYDLVDFALMIHKKHKVELLDVLLWVSGHKKSARRLMHRVLKGYSPKHLSPKKAIRILEFHDFKPIDEIRKRKFKPQYAYITSSLKFNRRLYVYPERLYDDYQSHEKTRSWQTVFEQFYLPGLIRINYSFEFKRIAKEL